MEDNKIKHGDILICSRNSLLSNIIRKATNSKYSHTAIAIEIWGRMYIVDMQRKGVELNTLEEWKSKWRYEYIIYRNINASQEYKSIAKRAISIVGRKVKYDLFTFIFRIPWKLITKKYKFNGEDLETKRLICSQLTGWVWKMDKWWEMTPDDQQKYLDLQKDWQTSK